MQVRDFERYIPLKQTCSSDRYVFPVVLSTTFYILSSKFNSETI